MRVGVRAVVRATGAVMARPPAVLKMMKGIVDDDGGEPLAGGLESFVRAVEENKEADCWLCNQRVRHSPLPSPPPPSLPT